MLAISEELTQAEKLLLSKIKEFGEPVTGPVASLLFPTLQGMKMNECLHALCIKGELYEAGVVYKAGLQNPFRTLYYPTTDIYASAVKLSYGNPRITRMKIRVVNKCLETLKNPLEKDILRGILRDYGG